MGWVWLPCVLFLIHSVTEDLLSTFWVPGLELGFGHVAVNIHIASFSHGHGKLFLLERWLSQKEHLLVLQQTGVGVPAPTRGGSPWPVTLAPVDPVPSSGIPRYQAHIQYAYKQATETLRART